MAGIKIFRSADSPSNPANPARFTGAVRQQQLGSDDAGTPARVLRVEFDKGGRTFWHSHTGPQWLIVVEGLVRVQKWGEPAQDVKTGDAVVIQPGEKHWHGAAPGASGVHVAVLVNAETSWLEPVTDQQYSTR